MNSIALMTDASLNPGLKLGVGAWLIVPSSFLEVSPRRIKRPEITERLILQRFENTSSTKLEVQTVLFALENYLRELKGGKPRKLYVYSDSSCVAGLLKRRTRLEACGFISRRTNSLLKNASLYREFYEFHNKLDFEVIKVAGHSSYGSHNTVHRIFSFIDRDARKALKLWVEDLNDKNIKPESAKSRAMKSTDNLNHGKWCVYVLKCRNNYLYIGMTNNIDKRLKEHDRGRGSKFVRSRRPFELLKTIPCKNAGEARKLEYNLKRLKRSSKIEVLGLKEQFERSNV